MGEKLPVVSGKDLLDFYLKCGCELKRIKGSHHVIKSIYNESMFVIPGLLFLFIQMKKLIGVY